MSEISSSRPSSWVPTPLVYLSLSQKMICSLKSLIGSGYALDLDRAYERGLALMVDGIFSRLARTR